MEEEDHSSMYRPDPDLGYAVSVLFLGWKVTLPHCPPHVIVSVGSQHEQLTFGKRSLKTLSPEDRLQALFILLQKKDAPPSFLNIFSNPLTSVWTQGY